LVKSYVKIYGPPVMEALMALEAIAVELSKATSVKFSHTCIPYPTRYQSDQNDWNNYMKRMQQNYVDCYEPVKLISESDQLLGEYDFFFEWSEDPKMDQLENLIGKIDEALVGMGCLYTITTE